MTVSKVLTESGFKFNKRYGQNFISDTNLLCAIADDAGVSEGDTVVEIGAGAGALTAVLAARAKKVTAFEIDENLKPVLAETLSGFNNVELIFGDFLKNTDVLDGLERYKVAANLPYYITTPVISALIERENAPESLSVMVQKEVAERLVARAGDAAYGALSIFVELAGEARITRHVSRKMFFPQPNVDSAVVRIDVNPRFPDDAQRIKKLVRAAFAMRRKTLVNNLINIGVSRAEAVGALEKMGLKADIRGETLSLLQYKSLADLLFLD